MIEAMVLYDFVGVAKKILHTPYALPLTSHTNPNRLATPLLQSY